MLAFIRNKHADNEITKDYCLRRVQANAKDQQKIALCHITWKTIQQQIKCQQSPGWWLIWTFRVNKKFKSIYDILRK